MNNIGRFNGADAIQRFQQAQQANTPQVDNQNESTSQTKRKPVSKKDLADLMKGKVKDLCEPTSGVNTNDVTEQEVHDTVHDSNNNKSVEQRTTVRTYYDSHGVPQGFEVIQDGRVGWTIEEYVGGMLSYYESYQQMFNPGNTLNDDINNPDDWHLN